jgi:hypothetical protein
MCIDCGWIFGEGLKEPEVVSVRDWRELGRPLVPSADRMCPLENVRDEPRGCTAPVAWRGQARLPQFDLHPKTVLFHHEVSAIAGFRCGIRGKISITSIRPW